MDSRRSPHSRSAADASRPDAVDEMRRRLNELLSASGRPEFVTPERVRMAEGGSADSDTMGTRSGASDPQRVRSTGFRTSRRGRRNAHRDNDSHPAETGRDVGRWADPVAAGSEWGEQEAGAGISRPMSEPTPQGGTVEQAKEACLRLLAVRARSRAELAQRLAAKGFTAEVTDRALDRLTEVGLIDDAAFAEQWVHSRHTFSGKGKQALAQELRRKGVAPADAAPALDAITCDDEADRAAELVRRKLRTLPRNLDRDKALRRLVGMLARRGYPQSTAFAVVKAELTHHNFDTTDLDPEPD